MKKITILLMMLFVSSLSFAQNAPITFEPGEHGADWTWTVFENGTNPALEIIDNPDATGPNTSSKVAKFTALQAGQPWAGVESMQGNLGEFYWDETNRIVKIMVWKSVISDVGIKFDAGANPNDWSAGEIKVANTVINEWEELTFDFSNSANPPTEFGGLKRIAIFPDFDLDGRDQDNIAYFDNISFHPSGAPATEPTVAAPAPTFDAANVISLHSEPYTDVPVDTWRTDWSQAAYEEVMIDGRPTKKYSNLDFVGIETVANQIDITGMTHFHMHVWSTDFTLFKVKLVDIGPDGAFGGGDDTEHELEFSALPQGEWVSLSIPLADFTSLQNRQNIAQLILAGQPSGATTVFVDNVLFYNDSGQAEGPNAPIDFETGGFGADWTWTVFENDNNPALEIIANPDPSGGNTSATVAKFTALQAGQPWAGVESLEGDLGEFFWDGTNTTVKIMVWKSVISDVGIKFDAGADPNNWSAGEIKVANTVINEWEELTFDFSGSPNPPSEFGGLKRIAIFPDFDMDGRAQDNIVYFDNITFSGAGSPDAPPVPAGLLVSNMIGDDPVGDGELFLACGPNQVGGDIVYKLFYSKTAEAPTDPTTATEYTFGTTAGDGDGINAFGFVLSGLEPGTSYTAWLYQYNTDLELFSNGAATGTAVSGGGGTTPDAPTVAAPTPTIAEANVISLFSDAYTDVTVDTWRTDWSVADYEEVTIDGNPTKKYSNLDFVGVETVANQIDITGMTHFHAHVWSADFTTFRVKLVDFGADAGYGGGDDTEHEVPFTDLEQGEWISLNIPLVDFTNLQGRQNIAQLIFSGLPSGAFTVYIDNVLFYSDGTSVNELDPTQNQVRVYPNPVRSGESVSLNAQVKQVDVFDLSGRMILSSESSVINTAGINRGVYFVRIHTLDGGLQTQKLIVN